VQAMPISLPTTWCVCGLCCAMVSAKVSDDAVVAGLRRKLVHPHTSLSQKYRVLFSLRNTPGSAAEAAIVEGKRARTLSSCLPCTQTLTHRLFPCRLEGCLSFIQTRGGILLRTEAGRSSHQHSERGVGRYPRTLHVSTMLVLCQQGALAIC